MRSAGVKIATVLAAVGAVGLALLCPAGSEAAEHRGRLSRRAAARADAGRPEMVDVIIRYDTAAADAEDAAVESLGGRTRRRFDRVRMRAIRISARQLRRLASRPGVSFVALDEPVQASSWLSRVVAGVPEPSSPGYVPPASTVGVAVLDSGVDETPDLNVAERIDFSSSSTGGAVYRDEFPTLAFTGSTGTDEWSTPWTEGGETDGAGGGFVRVSKSSSCGSGNCLRLGAVLDDGGTISPRRVEREVDLTGVAEATLTYSYRRAGGSSGSARVDVLVSGDGGASWIVATTHSLNASDKKQVTMNVPLHTLVDLSPTTRVGFSLSGQFPEESSRYLYVDNVKVEVGQASADAYGHGTHVAGVIAGRGAVDSSQPPGVAKAASIHSVRVLDDQGRGTVSDVIAGLDWVLANASGKGLRVVNLSLGKALEESAATDPLVQAVEAVWDAGIVVVCSAGNYGRDGHFTITSPGNSPKVLTVGSVTDAGTEDTSDDYVSTFSSRGPTLIDHFLKPDLVAPGNRLVSVNAKNSKLKKGLPERQRGNGEYLELSGTSMAAAMVSGAATLLLSAEPGLGPATVKARLMKSARKVPGADPTEWGAGVLDVTAALAATGSVTAAPSPQMTRLETGAIVVADPAELWGSEDWDAEFLWSDGYAWANGYPWATGYPWANGYPWATGYPWSQLVHDLRPLLEANAQSLSLDDDTP